MEIVYSGRIGLRRSNALATVALEKTVCTNLSAECGERKAQKNRKKFIPLFTLNRFKRWLIVIEKIIEFFIRRSLKTHVDENCINIMERWCQIEVL